MALKDLKLSLIVEALDRATAPLRAIGRGLDGMRERTDKLKGAMHSLGLAEFIGAGALAGLTAGAGKAIWDLTDKTAELGENMLHASIKAGVTVETMQRLGFAAKQLGVDQDSLSQVFFRFQTHLANAAQGNKETRGALKLLGISMADLGKLSKDPQEAFLRLVDGFSKLKNPTERAKLAMDLFSRNGYQILPMLTAGREEIARFMGQLDAAHAVMTGADAKASEEFIQKKNQMGLALQGLQLQIGVRLLPALSKLVDRTTAWVERLRPEVVNRVTGAIERMTDRLPALLPRIERLGELALKVADALLRLTDHAGLVKTALFGLGVLISAQLLVSFVSLVATIGGGLAVFGAFAGTLLSLIELSAGVRTFAGVMALLDIALDANPIGVLILAIGALIGAIALVGAGVYQIYKHWSGITAFFAGLWQGVINTFTTSWKKLSDLTPDWLKVLLKLGAGAVALSLNPLGVLAAPVGAAHPPSASAPGAGRSDAHVHVHLTSDGQTRVKAISSGPGVKVTADRGVLPP